MEFLKMNNCHFCTINILHIKQGYYMFTVFLVGPEYGCIMNYTVDSY
jgi:hypothetical protein